MTAVKRYIVILLIFTLVFPTPSVFALDRADESGEAVVESFSELPQAEASPVALETESVDVPKPATAQILSVTPEVQLATPAPVQIVPVKLQQSPIPANREVIVSGIEVVSGTLRALELRSMSDDFVDLSAWRIEAVYVVNGVEESCEVGLSGFMFARQYISITGQGLPIQIEHQNGAQAYEADFNCGLTAQKLAYIEIYKGPGQADITERIKVEDGQDVNGRWIRKGLTVTSRTGVFLTDFSKPVSPRLLYYGIVYQPPTSMPLQITELLITPSACAPNNTSVICGRYIKIYNSSDASIDLGNYRLRGGALTSASTASNTTPLNGVIGPKEMTVITSSSQGTAIYLGSTEGSAWFEDSYGLKDYRSDSSVIPYSGATNVSNTGKSWAFDKSSSTWKWGAPSPFGENTFIVESPGMGSVGGDTLKPCRDDQYRSEETNRCRNLASAATGLTPCKEGQYRSEETNRCRSIASAAAATLKPCADDQFRSLETNRCRKIASSDDAALVDCGEGRERNPETNRCRNVLSKSVPEAAFAVESAKDSGKAFIGWWALGGVVVLALGYGVWEWRREMLAGIQKVITFFTSSK